MTCFTVSNMKSVPAATAKAPVLSTQTIVLHMLVFWVWQKFESLCLIAIEILGKSCINSSSIGRTNITRKIWSQFDISRFVRSCVSESKRCVPTKHLPTISEGNADEHTYHSEVNHQRKRLKHISSHFLSGTIHHETTFVLRYLLKLVSLAFQQYHYRDYKILSQISGLKSCNLPIITNEATRGHLF